MVFTKNDLTFNEHQLVEMVKEIRDHKRFVELLK